MTLRSDRGGEVRFELFDGPRSIGTVAWGPEGVRIESTDLHARMLLALYFTSDIAHKAPGLHEVGREVQIRIPGWSPWQFERACALLPQLGPFRLAPRPAGGEHGQQDMARNDDGPGA